MIKCLGERTYNFSLPSSQTPSFLTMGLAQEWLWPPSAGRHQALALPAELSSSLLAGGRKECLSGRTMVLGMPAPWVGAAECRQPSVQRLG